MGLERELGGRRDPVPLAELALLTTGQVETLKGRWINSVEALVGTAASASGRKGLLTLLEMTDGQMAGVLQRASELLGPQRFQESMSARPGGPTGALLTDQQKKDLGL